MTIPDFTLALILFVEAMRTEPPARPAQCLLCGCTDFQPCIGQGGPCAWVQVDRYAGWGLCSACLDDGHRWPMNPTL